MRPKINEHVCSCMGLNLKHSEPLQGYRKWKRSHDCSVHGEHKNYVIIFGQKMFLSKNETLAHKSLSLNAV